MSLVVEEKFMQQQGFREEASQAMVAHFYALRFQPWIVGSLMLLATVLQEPVLFLALAAALAWNVALPQWNPFERTYDWLIGRRRGQPPLAPAPAPRQFAQGMAAVFMVCAGLALWLNWRTTAYVFEAMLVIAFTALLAGKFCLGAYIYHLLRGRTDFANATCPWSR